MNCGNCGKEISDGSEFCPYCGKKLSSTTNDSEISISEFFVEPDETLVSSLGDGYLRNFLTTGKLGKCEAILSDKRVYLRGNMLDSTGKGITRVNLRKTIDIEDITGTGFIYDSTGIWELAIAIPAAILGIILFLMPRSSSAFLLGSTLLIASVTLLLHYFLSRKTFFFVEYAGGYVKFDISIYGLKESMDFEKQIRRAKNRLKRG